MLAPSLAVAPLSHNLGSEASTLFNPYKPFTLQDLRQVHYLIRDLPEKIGSVDGKEIVFVIGNTGVGKSTTINYLLGHQIKKENDVMFGDYPSCVAIDGIKLAPVGHQSISATLYPEIFFDHDGAQLAYYDCPGFIENRGQAERICASIGTELAFKSACKANVIKLMIVVDIRSLTVSRGNDFKILAQTLGDLLKDPDALNGSVLFVFTRCQAFTPQAKEKLMATISEMGKRLSVEDPVKKILALIENNPDNVVLFDVFDSGNGRVEIKTKLAGLKSAAKSIFDFTYDVERKNFDALLFKLAERGQRLIDDIDSLFRQLQKDKDDLISCKENLPFYAQQIADFQAPEAGGRDQQIAILKQKMQQNSQPLRRFEQAIVGLEDEVKSDELLLKQINIEALSLWWQDSIIDQRWRWLFTEIPLLTCTSKTFEFYPSVDINPHDLIVNQNCNNGTFFVTKALNVEGYYQSKYTSEQGKDAQAEVKIYIKTKNKPDNKIKIVQLENRIQDKKNLRDAYEEDKNRLGTENQAFNKSIELLEKNAATVENALLRNLNDLKLGQRNYLAKLDKLTQAIPASEAQLAHLIVLIHSPGFGYSDLPEKLNHSLSASDPHRADSIADDLSVFEIVLDVARIVNSDSHLLTQFCEAFRGFKKSNLYNKGCSSNDSVFKFNFDGQATTMNPVLFNCPIGLGIMIDPVMINCGHSFERSNITKFFNSGSCVCPLCRQEVNTQDVKPNIHLKSVISDWQKKQEDKFTFWRKPLNAALNEIDLGSLENKLEIELGKRNKKVQELIERKNALNQWREMKESESQRIQSSSL